MTTQLSKVDQTLDSSVRQNKKNDVVDGGGDLVTSATHSPNITKESMDQAMPVPKASESSDMTDNENEEDTSDDYSNPEMYFPPDFEGLESIELVDGESNTVTEPENASNGAPNPISIEEFDKNLPSTVKLLTTPDGGKLYLVGTAHFSVESRNDVSMVIQAVQPHIVVVELCKSRIGLLHCDEDAIDQFTKNFTFRTILGILQNEGLYSGLVQILMQRMAMRIANELGLSPGGEFRRAFLEAKKIPHCAIHIADRPIDITIQRALRSMSWWQFLKVGWHLFTMKGLVTPGEVELFKRHEMLEDMVASVSQEFPELGEVFIKERDIYMAYCLQISCLQLQTPTGTIPARVVGVVGLGHTPGILQYWRKVQPSDIPPLLRVPPMSLSSKILLYTFKASFVGAILYVGYKIIPVPVPSGITLDSIKSSVMGLLKVSMEAIACTDEYEHAVEGVMYVVNNIPGPGVDMDDFELEYSTGCSCILECFHCSCTRGSANYNDNKIVDEKLAEPILECNPRCKCSKDCGNRVVQNGPLDSLIVSNVGNKGLGLITTKFVGKGRFICEYAGEVISKEEARRRIEDNKTKNAMNYVLVVSEHIGDRTIVTCIDPMYFGNIGRYSNHSCRPNANLVPVRIEGVVPRLCLFASRDIESGEEVTFNYAGGVANSVHCLSNTPCLCRAPNCSGYLPHNPI